MFLPGRVNTCPPLPPLRAKAVTESKKGDQGLAEVCGERATFSDAGTATLRSFWSHSEVTTGGEPTSAARTSWPNAKSA